MSVYGFQSIVMTYHHIFSISSAFIFHDTHFTIESSNNKVLAKFAGVCKNAIKNEIPCTVCTTKNAGAYPLTPQTNIYSIYKAIYTRQNLGNADTSNAEIHSIFADSEEVAK